MLPSDEETLPHDQVTGRGRSRLVVGQGIPRTVSNEAVTGVTPTEEPRSEDDTLIQPEGLEVKYRRRDGSDYDKPPAKNISDHPLHKVHIEVDEEGQEVLDTAPIFPDQFINKAFEKTWVRGPVEYKTFNLAEAEELKEWNVMQIETEPPGAPRTFIIRVDERFDERAGCWKILAVFRRIKYKKIISIT